MGGPFARILEVPLHMVASLQSSIGQAWDHYIALQNVWEENQQLQQEIQRLQGEQNLFREQTIITSQFQQLLAYQETTPMTTLPARIIGRNVSNWYRAMIINKGNQDGIRPEMGVITHAGVVGRVVRVNPTTAVVLLLSDPNVAITGMVQKSRDEGLVQGTPQGTIHMKYLPPLSPVQPGDPVVTSGLTDDFPRGLQIGRIRQVTKADTDLFQLGEIDPIVDFAKLEAVLVITSFQPVLPSSSPKPPVSPSP
ncbi:MAG: rod shape-determining protein MreC [Nitrospirales bacterium]|nr:rod shape-determining protein MreC [Nitrospirales bacterium]